MNPELTVKKIFTASLAAVDPVSALKKYAGTIVADLLKQDFQRVFIAGFGKAAGQMAMAVSESIGADVITDGVVITKYGHAVSDDSRFTIHDSRKIRVYEAGHPIPDENGLKATGEVISLLQKADKHTLVLCLISGGGSALLTLPYDGITLDEKQQITQLLLKAGADIFELNSIRKHISGVKGGRLAEIAAPATVVSLILSDVIGDRLDVIASGTTAPDTSTFKDALNVIHKYGLEKKIPASILDVLNRGGEGLIPETPKQDNPVFNNVTNMIIGSNPVALNAAKHSAQALGLDAEITSADISGEAKEAGKRLAEKAINVRNELRACIPTARRPDGRQVTSDKKKICLISGGETTVTVKGNGKGGRNTELALSFAVEIQGVRGITLLSAGTDGTDGPTDAAGAIVDGETIDKAKSLGLDPAEYLTNNDSYTFFKQTGSLLITGPTGTNVMDLQIILIE